MRLWFNQSGQLIQSVSGTLSLCDECPCGGLAGVTDCNELSEYVDELVQVPISLSAGEPNLWYQFDRSAYTGLGSNVCLVKTNPGSTGASGSLTEVIGNCPGTPIRSHVVTDCQGFFGANTIERVIINPPTSGTFTGYWYWYGN